MVYTELYQVVLRIPTHDTLRYQTVPSIPVLYWIGMYRPYRAAVACLDGDGCKVRSGLTTADDGLNFDTSIACDSCDIW
ncbi:hypothetical protein GW17_00015377 [Ensete ventricosum]|nr:hypothetical protein GW17_00015377 [Ensete ventricosum]RZR80513.1 hypothetical protein BHM03_00006564 [Ensete ventricosum]